MNHTLLHFYVFYYDLYYDMNITDKVLYEIRDRPVIILRYMSHSCRVQYT
jgi:hypothetical protein